MDPTVSGKDGETGGDRELGPCPICGRPMIENAAVDRHHWIPKKYKGTEWSWLHRICHKKLHSLYDEHTLATVLNTPESLLARDEIRRFVTWVRKQPHDKLGRHRPPARGKR